MPTVAQLKALRPYAYPSALPADWQEALGEAMAADVPQHLRPRGAAQPLGRSRAKGQAEARRCEAVAVRRQGRVAAHVIEIGRGRCGWHCLAPADSATVCPAAVAYWPASPQSWRAFFTLEHDEGASPAFSGG